MMLEMHLHEMQIELENLVWDKKELEERLQIAIKDRRIIESILAEFEEEHDKAIYQIELQEGELQELKDENFRLNEIQEKGLWNFKARDDPGSGQKDNFGIPLLTEYGIPSLKAGYSESGVILQNLMHRDAWEDKNGFKIRSRDFLTNMNVDEALNQCRKVALSQSLFSAFLSLLVGMIIWEAEDPCVPLVVALFTVVGMSLKSVVEFFSTIKNKPASDAVALLSFNWFILGTLTYPTLPRVAHMLAPHARIIVERIFSWLGLSSS
ncbi:hypothetical protein HHK36_028337 [Tetracentron sinense]|uniref:Uncharacterized protein n=1 Tax=Tetracentron sinense TaxID=13715 RepID=A0A835D1Z8_TETSI|nr:hypothetical protein HHK36_028337 [Tetracentron sinense]